MNYCDECKMSCTAYEDAAWSEDSPNPLQDRFVTLELNHYSFQLNNVLKQFVLEVVVVTIYP